MKTLFFDFVVECCRAVWFNSPNFPKTEVGSGKSGAPVQTLENLEMKKTLVAIAALAAFGAQAQSAVSIDGQFDAGLASINYKGNKTTGVLNNGSTTSQINFRGVEDLGGGLKATFRVETDWNTVSNNGNTGVKKADGTVAAGSSFANGEIRGGLTSAQFGSIDFGAINNAQLDAFLTGQPYGTAIGGGFRGIFVSDAASAVNASVVRFDNSVRYLTPSFSGVSASVLQVKKNTVANSTNFSTTFGNYDYAGVSEYSLRYNNGPLNAIYGVTKQDLSGTEGATVADATLKTLGANYTYGAFKFFVLSQTAGNNLVAGGTSLDRKANMYSVAYTMGQHVFTGGLASATNSITAATNTGKSKMASLGYDYNLSKMSSVYARYESIKDEGGIIPNNSQQAAPATGETTRSRTAVGLRIGF
jgi:predicted porin